MGTAFDYSLRPEFQYADLGVKLGEFDVRRYQLSKMPTLTINGYYNKNAQRNTFDFFAAGGDWFGVSAFTLNLNIPIFQGFSANARIARARLQLQQYVNQRENLKLTIDNEIATAQNNFVAAVSNLNYQKSNMQLAETIYQQTKKKFEIGTGAQTEINQAQSDLVLAQTNYISSLYDAVIAKIDFMKATGRLNN
jgi:outer membrane protein TolC